MEVRRLRSGKDFEGNCGNFESDTLFDREPVKSAEGRGNVVASFVVR